MRALLISIPTRARHLRHLGADTDLTEDAGRAYIIRLMFPVIHLPRGLQRKIDPAVRAFLHRAQGGDIDFARPQGEEALVHPNSVSWRVFKNPVALFVGGVAAVILELAEPGVRTGIWEHSSFRKDPLGRLRRTALAALVTVYGPRSIAEPMIASVVRMHAKVVGHTPAGLPYAANDAQLLTWVHATAGFGFAEAYSRYVRPLSGWEFDALCSEGTLASRLYGVLDAPKSSAELRALFDSMRGRLEPSPIVFEFLRIMRDTPCFPTPLHRMQHLLVRAAVAMIPGWIRDCLGLSAAYGLRPGQGVLVRLAGMASDRIVLPQSPAAQSCLRLGFPVTHLHV